MTIPWWYRERLASPHLMEEPCWFQTVLALLISWQVISYRAQFSSCHFCLSKLWWPTLNRSDHCQNHTGEISARIYWDSMSVSNFSRGQLWTLIWLHCHTFCWCCQHPRDQLHVLPQCYCLCCFKHLYWSLHPLCWLIVVSSVQPPAVVLPTSIYWIIVCLAWLALFFLTAFRWR